MNNFKGYSDYEAKRIFQLNGVYRIKDSCKTSRGIRLEDLHRIQIIDFRKTPTWQKTEIEVVCEEGWANNKNYHGSKSRVYTSENQKSFVIYADCLLIGNGHIENYEIY